MKSTISFVAKRNDPEASEIVSDIGNMISGVTIRLLGDHQQPAPTDILIFTSPKPVGGCLVGHNLVVTSSNGNGDFGTKRLIAIDKHVKKSRKEPISLENTLIQLVEIATKACDSKGDYCWLWGITPSDPSAIGSAERISAGSGKKNAGNDPEVLYPSIEFESPSCKAGW